MAELSRFDSLGLGSGHGVCRGPTLSPLPRNHSMVSSGVLPWPPSSLARPLGSGRNGKGLVSQVATFRPPGAAAAVESTSAEPHLWDCLVAPGSYQHAPDDSSGDRVHRTPVLPAPPPTPRSARGVALSPADLGSPVRTAVLTRLEENTGDN